MSLRGQIPNCITAMNLLCGLIALVYAFEGRVAIAFYLMLAAALFDFADGFVARALGSTSAMGKELDSLCDAVSFGVLPASMLYVQMKTSGESYVAWICLLFAIAAAFRLAKFNVDSRQASVFLGLPTPAAAIICGAFCHFLQYSSETTLAQLASGQVFIPVLVLFLSGMMLSEIPMFSLKLGSKSSGSSPKPHIPFIVLSLIAVLLCLICGLAWSLAVFSIFIIYILVNLVFCFLRT